MGGGAKALLNKKAFTLIELLAVIVILAIIALIATPQIMKIIKEVQDKGLEATKNSIIKASELYVVRNLDKFALAEGEKTYIQLSELEDGYIKKIKGSNGKSCEGYVKVEKTNEDFIYTVYLDCGNGDNLLVDSSYVNYGGNYLDQFNDVIKTKDGGYLAVGQSNSNEFSGNKRYGDTLNYDAIIVKYDRNGLEEWSHNFGGSSTDEFYSAIDDGNGYVIVGTSSSQDYDMNDLTPESYNSIIVKYDYKGNIITKKIINKYTSTSSGSVARDIIYKDNNYYITGDSRHVTNGYHLQFIAKYNSELEKEWIKTYGGSNYNSYGFSILENSSHQLVTFGASSSTNLEMSDIKIAALGNLDATLFIVDEHNGSIVNKGIFGGSGAERFYDGVEVSDGYILVGESSSNDGNMTGFSKGGNDAVVVKYSKAAVNGILPIEWIKVIGGSSDDSFRKIIFNNGELILIGYTNSSNGDLTNVTKANNGYYDGLLVKMSLDGNVISKATYGGSKSDYFYDGILGNDNYILVGTSFSVDKDIESFNLGNSDAILTNISDNLEPINNFKLQTLLKNQPKEVIVNYGTSIPNPETKNTLKLYTTNDASNDLGNWCNINNEIDPNGNYNSVNCLRPFDSADSSTLIGNEKILLENNLNINPKNNSNWIRLLINYGNYNQPFEVGNIKIRFKDKHYITIREAVDLGYIEPLVLIDSTHVGQYYLENSFALLSGESSTASKYTSLKILFKPKNIKLENISYNSSVEPIISQASASVTEYLNFDISLTPNNG